MAMPLFVEISEPGRPARTHARCHGAL